MSDADERVTHLYALARKTLDETAGSLDPSAFLRVEVHVKEGSALDWLRSQRDPVRVYWSGRETGRSIEAAGIGVADRVSDSESDPCSDVFERIRAQLKSIPAARYYGGFSFQSAGAMDAAWQSFRHVNYILPRFEWVRELDGTIRLAYQVRYGEASSAVLDAHFAGLNPMEKEAADWNRPFPAPRERADVPDRATWYALIDRALNAFQRGPLEKVVLARRVTYDFDESLNPVVLLQRLKRATPDRFHFCFMPGEESLAFVGASPERLVRRSGCWIETEALAGTRPRGPSPEADAESARALLASDKDRREHEYVRRGIHQALTPLCDSIEIQTEPSLMRLVRGHHLHSAITGRLRIGVSDGELVAALHPTAALGGYPKQAALRAIAEWEPFNRGWYAGPVGWVGGDDMDFAVAIRSGLIQSQRLSLYSGAGIVEGSTAENEWDEMEHKIGDFLKVLSGS